MTISEFLKNLESLEVGRVVKITLGETRDLIILQNQNQMIMGKHSDGTEITPAYTYFTRLKKKEQGRSPDIVTLYDTGDFYREMFVDIGSEFIEIDSTDWKSNNLKEKYGEKIFGLSQEGIEQYLEKGFDVFKTKVENILKLKI